ncbi:PRD domain-containing protein [Edaphobacillus lindanitolerans]|uniref:Transcriptional antiterminator, BglG family n=1 Tax=Edaphobacillus lindanitolerans TaxID=550447 RepID=A0A1U7PRU2_9BACI|nr:PRD domain-containing protein [Edaphobacillus lindanitolerans]SIT87923.1 transcriptional antiterminator, BglG family [Edaphobacillus lindanitolerans]
MKIKKILNNNAVIVEDEGLEKVVVGAGIAFNRKRNDPVALDKIEKIFIMSENGRLVSLLGRIPEEHFTLSERIISRAEEVFGSKLNEHIHLVLTDHLSFAIERTIDGIRVHNKLMDEIRLLYPEEFRIGLWAIGLVRDELGVEMPEDEAAFIALHLHTMKPQGGDLGDTIRQATILRDMLKSLRRCIGREVAAGDIAYQRLVTHLRHAVNHFERYEFHALDDEMCALIRTKYKDSYNCALEMSETARSLHGIRIPEQELAYITLHIERIRNPGNHG